jgi:hypothetical protein
MVVLFVSVYLIFAVGVLKATHFCMGREASVSYFTAESTKCPCSLFAGEKNSCCDDEHDLLRLENEQKTVVAFMLPVPQWMELQDLSLTTSHFNLHVTQFEQPEKSFSLPPPKIPLWKSQRRLVFYDDHLIG